MCKKLFKRVAIFFYMFCIYTLYAQEIQVKQKVSLPYVSSLVSMNATNGGQLYFTATAARQQVKIYFTNVPLRFLNVQLYKVTPAGIQQIGSFQKGTSFILEGLEIGADYKLTLSQSFQNLPVEAEISISEIQTLNNGTNYVSVSTNQYTVEQLVKDVLISGACANVSNISYNSGIAANPSIGYFEKNNSSFAFQSGLILSTGYAKLAEGPKGFNEINSETNMGGADPDLDVLTQGLGMTSGTEDACFIKFDFVPLQEQLSFNFVFASDEYGFYQCGYSDAFAFLLTDLETGVTTNLAVVPNTTTPISVTTIRNMAYNPPGTNPNSCPSVNPQYFNNYYEQNAQTAASAPIHFRGDTVPMVAKANVQPGKSYRIKFVIADYSDISYDSAVFLEAGSFDVGGIDLGENLVSESNNALCYGETKTLTVDLPPTVTNIKWYKNNVEIPGATTNTYTVTESGTYRVFAVDPLGLCDFESEIDIEILPNMLEILNQPDKIIVCDLDKNKAINLTQIQADILNNQPAADYTFQYYTSLQNLENGINPVTNTTAYMPQNTILYVKVIPKGNPNCWVSMKLPIEIQKPLFFTQLEQDAVYCKSFTLPAMSLGEVVYSAPNKGGEVYPSGHQFGVGKYKVYVVSSTEHCSEEKTWSFKVISCDVPKGISPNGDGKNDALDLSEMSPLQVVIFNRYGKKVYEHGKGYTNQWTGQSLEGDLLPSGTYFYQVVLANKTLEGWIELSR